MTDTSSDATVYSLKPKNCTLKDALKWYKTTFKLLFKYWYLWLAIIMLSNFTTVLFDYVDVWLQEILATYLPDSPVHNALPLIKVFVSITINTYLTGAFLVSAESVIENQQVLTENIWKKWRSGFKNMAKLSGLSICILCIGAVTFVILETLTTILSAFQNNPEHYTLGPSHDFFYVTLLTIVVIFMLWVPLWFMLPLLTLKKVTFKQAFFSSFNGVIRNILPLSIYWLPTILLILLANQIGRQIFYYFFSHNIYNYAEAIGIILHFVGPVLITLQSYIPYRDIYISPAAENH